jgi:hypothetical protein
VRCAGSSAAGFALAHRYVDARQGGDGGDDDDGGADTGFESAVWMVSFWNAETVLLEALPEPQLVARADGFKIETVAVAGEGDDAPIFIGVDDENYGGDRRLTAISQAAAPYDLVFSTLCVTRSHRSYRVVPALVVATLGLVACGAVDTSSSTGESAGVRVDEASSDGVIRAMRRPARSNPQ